MPSLTPSTEAEDIARRLLASLMARRERAMGGELINAAKELARHGAISAAMAALRLAQLDDLRRSALRKLKLELRSILKAT